MDQQVNKPKIYYAHHMQKYNTLFEEYELDLIKASFPNFTIINPNGDVLEEGTENEVMQACFDSLGTCSILIFSTVCGNCIGKGVYQEIEKAKELGLSIFFIFGDEIKSAKNIKLKRCNYNSSERFYATVNL